MPKKVKDRQDSGESCAFICLLRGCKCLFCHFNMTGKHTNSMLLSFLDMLYRGRIFGRKTAFFFFSVSIKSVKSIILKCLNLSNADNNHIALSSIYTFFICVVNVQNKLRCITCLCLKWRPLSCPGCWAVIHGASQPAESYLLQWHMQLCVLRLYSFCLSYHFYFQFVWVWTCSALPLGLLKYCNTTLVPISFEEREVIVG